MTSQQPLTSELPTLAEFLDDCQADWSRHLAQLRLKYPVTRSVQYSTSHPVIVIILAATTGRTNSWSWQSPSPAVCGESLCPPQRG